MLAAENSFRTLAKHFSEIEHVVSNSKNIHETKMLQPITAFDDG